MLWPIELAEDGKLKNPRAAYETVKKYFGTCLVLAGTDRSKECIAELRDIGEDWLADNFDKFTFGDG